MHPVPHYLLLLLLALTASAVDGQANAQLQPTFYVTCDSAEALLHPAIGPAGTLAGTATFVEGRRGKAYQVNAASAEQLRYPGAIVPLNRGTIECWARLVNPPALIPWHGSPALFAIWPLTPFTAYQISFNGNDGGSGGGLVAWTGYNAMSSGPFTQTFSYAEVLGGANQVQAWHHYAVAWDANGIPGTTQHMQLYLDGNPVGKPLHDSTQFPSAAGVDFVIGWIDDNYGDSAVAIDEFKIWDYAKSSFDNGEAIPPPTHFGNAVDLCGDRLAAADDNCARIYQRTGAGWRLQAQIPGITGIGHHGNGSSIQIAGDILAIGGSLADHPEGVAIYERSSTGTWSQQTVLTDPQVALDSSQPWGNAIDLDHNILVVGGTNGAVPHSSSRSVTIFERVIGPTGSSWILRDHLTNPLPTTGVEIDTFGTAVAVSGQTIAVSSGGQIWLYSQNADADWHWRREAASVPVAATRLALDGDTLVAGLETVGAPGIVRVFQRRVTGWVQQSAIPGPTNWPRSIALEGGLLAVRGECAAVSIYERVAGAWLLRQSLPLCQGSLDFNEFFTQTLALDGGTLVAGEPHRSGLTGPGIGRVAVITATGPRFVISDEIAPPTTLNLAKLGTVPALLSPVPVGTDADKVTITSTGAAIFGAADSCGFVPFVLTGDGEIVARILSQEPAATGYALNTSAKAGIMFRESLAPGARNVLVALMPSGLMFQWREFTNGVTTLRPKGAASAPVWLKMCRKGSSVAGYSSPDGVTWTMQGVRPFITGPIHAGLVVSNTATQAATVVFDGVTITPPPTPAAAATAEPKAPSASGLLLTPLLKK